MASVYTNDLRLEEIGSGEQSGTWGDTTNTNLELIAEGFSFGTEAITTNADTHTSTVADGATDPARSMFIKYTGTLDSTCTITIAPNTLSRMHFIENGTSGSQNIIISQGSGANVTIPPGDVKAVYLDGAGSGAAVVDAFASLSVGALTATTADNTAQLTLISTDADANAGPKLKLRRNSASPADDDLIGAIDWTSENSNGDEHDFLNLTARMRDVTAGSEDVAYAWTAYLGGTGREIQSFVNTDASAASMVFNEDSQDIDFRVESNGNANMLFVDGGNDAVIIGHNDGISISGEQNELQVYDTNFSVASFATFRNGSDGATLSLAHSRSGTIGTQTVLNDGDIMGAFNFIGSDGTDMATVGAAIRGSVDGTPGSNDMPGRLTFLTTADGAASPTERMRIDSSGKIGIATGAPLHVLDIDASATGAIPTDAGMGTSTENDNYFGFHNTSNSATFSGLSFETRTSGAARWLIANEWSDTYLGDLVFRARTGGSTSAEVMRIGSNSNVHIQNSQDMYYSGLVVGDGANTRGITIYTGTSSSGVLAFADGNSGSARYSGYIQYDHANHNMNFYTVAGDLAGQFAGTSKNFKVSAGNVIIGTAGKGIDFSAQTASSSGSTSSEILDHYEEGTWTPTITVGGSSINYTIQQGIYTKIGNIVHAQFYLQIDSGTMTSDGLKIGPMPFTSAANHYSVAAGYNNNSASSIAHPIMILFPSDTNIWYYVQQATGVTQVTGSTLGTGLSQLWRVTYRAA